jgi:hypothetical protein
MSVSVTQCVVCGYVTEGVTHSHHTTPQAYGGHDSLQVDLCSNCHNNIHAHALALITFQRNGKPIKRRFWNNSEQEARAMPLVQKIVAAEATVDPEAREITLNVTIDSVTHRKLKLLKQDLASRGITSLEGTLLFLIHQATARYGDKPMILQTKKDLWK